MIFVAAGTLDGRTIAADLAQRGYPVIASAVSEYGGELIKEADLPNLTVNTRPLDEEALREYLTRQNARLFIDATHPYAAQVSHNAIQVCARLKIPYLRYERPETKKNTGRIIPVESYEEAAQEAAALGQNIFLTVGSRNLALLVKHPALKQATLTARVLPTPEVLQGCQDLGLAPKQIVALQGPFSRGLNRELYQKYEAQVIVTKDSGQIGGTDTKIEAAADLNIPVVLIGRPKIKYPRVAATIEQVRDFVQENL
ncbi:MAG: cobalt-precorrin-6A reductase [Selenomonadaceae bacterium]|nr:cobalt-precorrin-6A reductase [Selenomonadaceae bacterium]